MKKSIKLIAVLVTIMFATSTFATELGINMSNLNLAPAAKKSSSGGGKAFEGKGSKTLSVGLGLSSYIGYFGKGGFNTFSGGRNNFFGTSAFYYSGTLSLQAEFGVHEYVGVGLVTGFGGRANGRRSFYGTGGAFYLPVGILANFHFFQLIADKKGLGVGDKLDIYVGLNFGTGLGVNLVKGGENSVGGIIFAGPQFGLKYFFNDKIGIYSEFGYGKSIFEAGVSIKL